MKFIIKNGQGLLYIGYHEEEVSYLHFKRPLVVDWYDGRGTVSQWVVLLPYSKEYREQFLNRYQEDIHKDYSTDIESLYTLLSPLWSLFENGFYELEYHAIVDNYNGVLYANEVNVDEDRKKQKRNRHYSSSFEFITSNFYPDEFDFLATQPKKELNKERVKYFEELIIKGERPFALIYRAYINFQYTNDYVLDGHHKLEAYHNLNIPPAVAIVTRDYCCIETIIYDDIIEENSISYVANFDLNVLKEHLYSCQFNDIKMSIEGNYSTRWEKAEEIRKHQIKIFAEIGYGNLTFFNTEIEKGKYEHRLPKFIVPPKIEGIYFRFWIWKRIFVISTKSGFSLSRKDRVKLKILFGIEGRR